MSTKDCTQCPTPTSTDGKPSGEPTEPYGALSHRQITARIQSGKWWPFDRVPGEILVKMNAKLIKQEKATINATAEEALL